MGVSELGPIDAALFLRGLMIGWLKKIFKKDPAPVPAASATVTGKPVLYTVKPDFFDIAMRLVVGFEGGVSNDKADHGGLTNFGVTQATYNAYLNKKKLPLLAVTGITPDQVKDIYREYWLESKADALPLKAAIVVFDMAINSGASRARRYWDLSHGDVWQFLALREQYYKTLVDKDPSQRKFLHGWMNRLVHLREIVARIKV